uniref:Hexosyltransferase n=1 Tax=Panagrolaimus sp. JU765 TaxID=591449 RepID=A0AC34QB20_9BILA
MKRNWVRKLWLNNTHENYFGYFFVGKTGNALVDKKIENEAKQYSDMVIVDFRDAYRNLTAKVYTMLAWKQKFCNEANYFLRTNDDTVVNFTNLHSFTKNNNKNVQTKQIYGYQWQNPVPMRDINNKWYVTRKEFAGDTYPDFCAGWSCLYTKSAVDAVLKQAPSTNYLWLDDVIYGGILAEKGNVSRIHLPKIFIPDFQLSDYRKFVCGRMNNEKFIALHFHELDAFLAKNDTFRCLDE